MNMESNKILAAVLVAGITAYACGIVSKAFVPSEKLAKNAYEVQATEAPTGGGEAAAPTGPEPIKDLLAKADPAQGEKVSKICSSCHTFAKGEPNRIGPNLNGVVGRSRASVADFTYSDALKAKGGKWDSSALNEFLWSPQKAIPGTKMTFAGLPKAEDRAAIIKWLESQK
jgi:cytochrome c